MSELSERIQLLGRVLREQIWLLEELSGLLSAQLAAVRQGRRQALEESTQQLESLNHLLAGVESRRLRLLEHIAGELGQPVSSLTLARLAARCEADTGRRLLDLAARLGALVSETAGRRALLRQLLEKHSEHLGKGLEWLRRLAGRSTYGRDGRLHDSLAGARMIDRTA
jgi:flagellar biosynthesis/type III secretory pathway chaperone